LENFNTFTRRKFFGNTRRQSRCSEICDDRRKNAGGCDEKERGHGERQKRKQCVRKRINGMKRNGWEVEGVIILELTLFQSKLTSNTGLN
jgi:hypothetical protein